jgi:type VI secretion system protein ImpE
MKPSEFMVQGDLQGAIAAALNEVKQNPGDHVRRWHYAELLCFGGDLAKADKQLEITLSQEPRLAMNVAEFRRLIRAELSRREIFTQGRIPEFVGECTPAAKCCLEALAALRNGDEGSAQQALGKAEEIRIHTPGQCNGEAIEDVRDLDDLLGPVCEVLTARGDCAWLPLELIGKITFSKPERPRDLLWREAEVVLKDEQQLSVFVPALYCGSHQAEDEQLRLGRGTAWQGDLIVRGTGQRMWMIGDDAKGILEIETLELAPA